MLTMSSNLPTWPQPLHDTSASVSHYETVVTDDWILEDAHSTALLKIIDQVAPSDAGVLILGDCGTDKEMIARHIHRLSPRRNGPFVTVNCGALSESLISTELFGHENGAFTGAFGSLPGYLENAHLGTLLLDEIDDLPLHMQSKLVRVLQEKAVIRLGTTRRIPVDVRVLAASCQSLEQSVAAKRFREDLFYLLNVVTLNVLPLRQRPGDVLPLAHHFIASYCQRMHYASVALSKDAKQKLLEHSWPGNSRELENVIHRALLLTQGLRIGAQALQLTTSSIPAPSREQECQHQQNASSLLALEEALEGLCDLHPQGLEQLVQNALLLKVWQRNRCNQAQTARQLGISRSVVRARLLRLGQISSQVEEVALPFDKSLPTDNR